MSDTLTGVTTGSFERVLWPPQVQAILNLLIGGSPFANSLTRINTSSGSVAFPTASPDSPAWLEELAEIPIANLNDDVDVVAVCKLATIVLISNEAVRDTTINLTGQFQTLLRDSASAELDRGLLYGDGSPEPDGVVAAADTVEGDDLAAALTAAVADIGDSGGTVTHVAARPSVFALARNARATDGQMLYPAGIGAAFGVTEVPVPMLEAGDVLGYDAVRLALLVRDDFGVDMSSEWAFRRDATALRLRGRFAIGPRHLGKIVRRLVIRGGNGNGETTETSAAHVPSTTARPRAERP